MLNKQGLKAMIEGSPADRRYIGERDFSLFFTYYYLDYIKYEFADFHFEMFQDVKDLFSDELRELLWAMYRDSAKTSISKGLLMWIICFKKRKYPNVDAFDKENAERILFDLVFEMQTNKKIIEDFGELFNAKRNPDEIQQKRVNNFVTNTGIRVEAHSTQESVRGRLHRDQRPDFLLLDDFETTKTKDSVAYTKQVIDHINEFKSGLSADAKVLYLGNYITEHGSIQTLLDRAKTDKRLRVRMVNAINEYGIPTWHQRYSLTDAEVLDRGSVGYNGEKTVSLEDKKIQLGSQVFQAEMMNSPIDEETQVFFKTNFRYRTMEEVEKMQTRKFATIDSALTRNAKSDFTGVTKNWVNTLNEWHFVARRYKISSMEVVNMIFQLHDEGFEMIGIEEGAFTEAIKPFFDEECEKRNKYPYLVMLKHKGTMKETRIRGLVPRYERHKIYHIQGECDDLENELLRFPHSVHDDTMDSAQYQLDIAAPPYELPTDFDEEVTPKYSDIGI